MTSSGNFSKNIFFEALTVILVLDNFQYFWKVCPLKKTFKVIFFKCFFLSPGKNPEPSQKEIPFVFHKQKSTPKFEFTFTSSSEFPLSGIIKNVDWSYKEPVILYANKIISLSAYFVFDRTGSFFRISQLDMKRAKSCGFQSWTTVWPWEQSNKFVGFHWWSFSCKTKSMNFTLGWIWHWNRKKHC